MVASQDPVQLKRPGAQKRLSARGGAAYGTPRNWSTCFHEVPTWMAWDLPSSRPWMGMVTEGADVPKLSRGLSVGRAMWGRRRRESSGCSVHQKHWEYASRNKILLFALYKMLVIYSDPNSLHLVKLIFSVKIIIITIVAKTADIS